MRNPSTYRSRLLALGLLMLAAAGTGPLFATNLTGTFHKPDGTPVNGKLIFLLSQPARLDDNSAQVVPTVKIFTVANGQLEPGAFVYGNDALVPAGTYYLVRLVDDGNNLLFEQKWSIQGSDLDLGTLTPTTTGVVLPDPLVKNVTTEQAVQGPVTFNAGLTALSLTLNGSLNPGAPDSFDLGTASARWREINAQRIGGWVMPGTAAGLVTPPSTAPAVTNSATGGTIADGTYYIKTTLLTCSNAACTTFGETTASPAQTVVAAGGGATRLQVPYTYTQGTPREWQTGAVGYYVYASNDNVNFYRQTLDPVGGNQDCQLDTQAHIINCGSGSMLTSLTFSGTQPPSVNSAAISPLQVAVNSVKNISANSTSAMVVAAGAYTLTTPLVLSTNHRLDCASIMDGRETAGRITSAITHPKLATVIIAGKAQVSGCHIENTAGNGLLLMNFVSAGNSTMVRDGSIRTTSTANAYAAVVIQGVWYDLQFLNNYMAGDKAVVMYRNVSGSNHVFHGRRWDVGTDHAVWHDTGPTDPDINANNGAFPNGMNQARFENILFETGNKEWFHALNVAFEITGCQFADPQTDPGTAGMFRIGSTAGMTAQLYNIVIKDSIIGNHANFGAGIFEDQWNGLVVRRVIVEGSDLAPTNLVDANNLAGGPVYVFIGSGARPYEAATSRKFVNFPTGRQWPFVIGTNNDGLDEVRRAQNSFTGGVRFVDNNSNASSRYLHWRATGTFTGTAGDPAAAGNRFFDWTASKFTFLDATPAALLDINHAGGRVGIGRTVQASGVLGFPNNFQAVFRNNANSAECSLLAGDTSDRVVLGGTSACFPHFPRTGANPPFTVASSTAAVVANLDADKWDGKHGIDFSATLDFGSIAAQSCASLTATATAAAAGSPVAPAWPAALEAGLTGIMHVTSAGTVSVRLCNVTASAVDPASATFAGRVIQ